MAKKCPSCDWPYNPDSASNCNNCGSSMGCFITTAVCEFAGLPDDCHELTVLRAFRDRHMASAPARAAMLQQYYAKSPDMVARINQRADRGALYRSIRQRFIAPAVEAAEAGDDALAESIYVDGMGWLSEQLA